MQARQRKILKRVAVTLAVVTVLFFGLVGFAHTSAGRPIPAWLSGAGVTGGCLLGFDQVDLVAAEAFRVGELPSAPAPRRRARRAPSTSRSASRRAPTSGCGWRRTPPPARRRAAARC
ncbi:MAG: hypothetical protein U1F43_19245 [Myxococcota bacterium]